jgi:hypothetical protein
MCDIIHCLKMVFYKNVTTLHKNKVGTGELVNIGKHFCFAQ